MARRSAVGARARRRGGRKGRSVRAVVTSRPSCRSLGAPAAQRTMSVTRQTTVNNATVQDGITSITPGPNLGAIYDPRMGPYQRGLDCHTCQQDSKNCPGHFGHINVRAGAAAGARGVWWALLGSDGPLRPRPTARPARVQRGDD